MATETKSGDGGKGKDIADEGYSHLRTWEDNALYVQIQSTQANFVDAGDPFMDRLAKAVNDAMTEAYEKIKKVVDDMPELKDKKIIVRVYNERATKNMSQTPTQTRNCLGSRTKSTQNVNCRALICRPADRAEL